MAESRMIKMRRVSQALFAALSNGYAKGFATAHIFEGKSKAFCTPGMNCYSCPGALFACPIGSLQATLNASEYRIALYVAGFLCVFGAFFGRFICGFLCPFGFLQDVLFKIPFVKKIRRVKGEAGLRFVRFGILAVFVVILPLFVVDFLGMGEPWFCKYICPVGTLEGGIPLLLLNKAMRGAIGWLFRWKLCLLALTLASSLVVYRPFCRWICPLGAIYALFNRVALVNIWIDSEKCTKCGMCQKKCKLDIPIYKNTANMDCIRCAECVSACNRGALHLGIRKKRP